MKKKWVLTKTGCMCCNFNKDKEIENRRCHTTNLGFRVYI